VSCGAALPVQQGLLHCKQLAADAIFSLNAAFLGGSGVGCTHCLCDRISDRESGTPERARGLLVTGSPRGRLPVPSTGMSACCGSVRVPLLSWPLKFYHTASTCNCFVVGVSRHEGSHATVDCMRELGPYQARALAQLARELWTCRCRQAPRARQRVNVFVSAQPVTRSRVLNESLTGSCCQCQWARVPERFKITRM
jgi:hypothetical protein